MKAPVVKVKDVADDDEAEKPVVTIQVVKNLFGLPAGDDNEFPQRTHLNRVRVAFELLDIGASAGEGSLIKRVSHRPRRDGCASRGELRFAVKWKALQRR
jgi:hypothetical protein